MSGGLPLGLTAGRSQEQPGTRAASAAPAERKIAVTVAAVEGRDVQRSVQIVGTLAPIAKATLGTETYSTVAQTFVDLGDAVSVGQPVVKLDDRSARLETERAAAGLQAARESLEASRANVDRAKAVLDDARLTLGRLQGLFAEEAISTSQPDSAQTQHDVAAAALRAGEAQAESDRAAPWTEEKATSTPDSLGSPAVRAAGIATSSGRDSPHPHPQIVPTPRRRPRWAPTRVAVRSSSRSRSASSSRSRCPAESAGSGSCARPATTCSSCRPGR